MNKIGVEFKRLLAYDRTSLTVFSIKAGSIFLFFIGLLMPYVIGTTNSISMSSKIIGGNFYTPLIVILLFVYILLFLLTKTRLASIIFKIITILSTLIVIWGLIFFFVGANPQGGDLGTGMLFMILFNTCMWYIFFKEAKVIRLINKYSKAQVNPQVNHSDISKEE